MSFYLFIYLFIFFFAVVLFIMLYKLVPNTETVDKILTSGDHSN